MRRFLLTIGLMVVCWAAIAQVVFDYGFETPSSALTVGKLDYLNFKAGDIVDSVSTEFHSGTKSLFLDNGQVTANNWERALKFRNINLTPNTSYRVSFWVKGVTAGNIRTRLMFGKENADVALVGSDYSTYDYSFTKLDSDNWVKKTAMFFYQQDSSQNKFYAKTYPKATEALDLTKTLCFNVFNAGKYYIDDIKIDQSMIGGVYFNNDVVKIDFGYKVNLAKLAKGKDYETAVLPIECVEVKLNDEVVEVEAVEIRNESFYIFLASTQLTDFDEGNVKVSFTNPTGDMALLYDDAKCPNAWDPTFDRKVYNVVDALGVYDLELSESSIIYSAPFFKTMLPENGSFNLPLTSRTFTATYSRVLDCSQASAVLVGPVGTVNLDLTETGYSDVLTFTVPSNVTLTAGTYNLTISGITTDFAAAEKDDQFVFEYGLSTEVVPTAADTLLKSQWRKDGFTFDLGGTNQGYIPYGYKVYWGTNVYESGRTGLTSCPRAFMFENNGVNEFDGAFYLCGRNTDSARLVYGQYENFRLHLTPGYYNVSWNDMGWTANDTLTTSAYTFSVRTMSNGIVYRRDDCRSAGNMSYVWKAPVVGSRLLKNTVRIVTEGDYQLWWVTPNNYNSHLLGNITVTKLSTALASKSLLIDAIAAATAVKAKADSSLYDGPAKDALVARIQQYTGAESTAPSWYVEAKAQLKTASDNMTTHKSKVDNYFTKLAAAKTKLAAFTNTVIARTGFMSAYPRLNQYIGIYSTIDLTSDAVCQMASDSLGFYTDYVTNVSNAVTTLKYRINKGVAVAKSLRIPVQGSALKAAEDTLLLVDNDQIANALNAKIKQYIDGNLAADSMAFKLDTIGLNLDSTANVERKRTTIDSLELTSFIKNPNFYTLQTANNLNSSTFVGWTTTATIEGIGVGAPATALNPVSDTYAQGNSMRIGSFDQTITGLPAGIYDFGFTTRMPTDVPVGWTLQTMNDSSCMYVTIGENSWRMHFTQAAFGWPSSTNTWISRIAVPEGASVKLGVQTRNFSGWAPTYYFGDPKIFMVGKDASFTYTGVKEIQPMKNVKEVQYYSIQGVRLNSAVKGLNIVRTIYDNNTVSVQKIMLK